jgi:hypothetical protein
MRMGTNPTENFPSDDFFNWKVAVPNGNMNGETPWAPTITHENSLLFLTQSRSKAGVSLNVFQTNDLYHFI